jgi:bifunctional non-homologous end joining protein LigD
LPAHRVDAAAPMVEASRTMGLEGVVAKRLASPYRPGERSRDWLKIKNRMRQEFVVGGWVPERGTSTNRLGSLLVGYYESKAGAQEGEPRLTYAGRVGTGFDDATQAELMARLRAAKRPASPFQAAPADADVQHVEPTLVVEVAFTEWTLTGHLRQPSFLAIRDDKDAEDVRREHPRRMPGGAS